MVTKCEKVVNIMRSLAGCDWGAERGSMQLVYQAMIRSVLDYGCFVYGSAAKSVLGKLDVLQAKALRLCCGAFKTSPVPALLLEMGEMPLRLRRTKLGLQYWAKVNGFPQSFPARCLLQKFVDPGPRVRHRSFLDDINQCAKLQGLGQGSIAIHLSWSPVPPWLFQEVDINLTFLNQKSNEGVGLKVDHLLNTEERNYLKIFTDGSVDPESGAAGFGIFVEQLGYGFNKRVTNKSSVFTAELLAILWALWWTEDLNISRVLICSDSAAALMALRGGKSTARPDIVIEILSVLFRVGKAGCEVKFCWVPGHAGIQGNETADLLENATLKKGETDVKIPKGRVEMRAEIKECVENAWQREWEKESKGRHYFSFHPQIKKLNYCQGNRKDSVKMCRLRLGHCGLKNDLYIIGKHSTGLCECGHPETVKHVMLECSLYCAERRNLFKTLTDLGLESFSIRTIFGSHNNHQQIEAAILQFLCDTRLCGRI